jgi:F0F1-type ATP synthase assembly protein I
MSDPSLYRQLAIYSSIIFLLPSGLVGGYLLGTVVDGYLSTDPWGSWVGLFLGGAGAFTQLFRLLNVERGSTKNEQEGE